jgi:hypothetical protein
MPVHEVVRAPYVLVKEFEALNDRKQSEKQEW